MVFAIPFFVSVFLNFISAHVFDDLIAKFRTLQ